MWSLGGVFGCQGSSDPPVVNKQQMAEPIKSVQFQVYGRVQGWLFLEFSFSLT